MMKYPAAYCVKCKEYTDASNPHTVLLKNNSRALTGACPRCQSKVYMIMPKRALRQERKSIYKLDKVFSHTAFCVKCKKSTQVNYAHGVIFQNGRKALRGQCESCGCDAYKILKEKIVIRDVSASRRLTATSTKQLSELSQEAKQNPWPKYAFFLVISMILGGFIAYLTQL